jgi:lipoprotein NlpD
VAALVLLGSAACSTNRVYHRVRPGETLYRISKAYGVPVKELTRVNHLSDSARIEVGQRLLVPGARRQLPVNLITPRATSGRPPQRGEIPKGKVVFAWPIVGGTVTSGFGERGHSFHDGIDISAPVGAPVHAAQDGEVIYSDVLRGYGNVIIVRHMQGFATVYAHNQLNRVREGQHVRQGDVIGNVGDSGRTSGANLHFEVRYDNVARDPLYFLPAIEQVAVPGPRPGRGG